MVSCSPTVFAASALGLSKWQVVPMEPPKTFACWHFRLLPRVLLILKNIEASIYLFHTRAGKQIIKGKGLIGSVQTILSVQHKPFPPSVSTVCFVNVGLFIKSALSI